MSNLETLWPSLQPMDEAGYRAHPSLGYHDLLALKKSYAHLEAYRLEAKPESNTLIFGTAAHIAALEPHKLDDLVAVLPSVDRRTKAGREAYEEFVASNSGKIVLPEADYDRLIKMRDSLMSSDEYRAIISCVLAIEHVAFGSYIDLPLKGRIDGAGVLPSGERFLLEYKTTQCADFSEFKFDIRRYRYDLQLLHYANLASGNTEATHGLENTRLYIVAQEKEPPYDFTITEVLITPELLDAYGQLLLTCKANYEAKTGYPKIVNEYVYF